MRRRHLGIGAVLIVISATGLLYARQAPPKAQGSKAAERLAVARQGYEMILRLVDGGVRAAEVDKLPLWSRRIMDAQIDETGDAVAAAREHLERMKAYAARVEAAYKVAQAPKTAALDGRYVVLEAESILANAQAR